MKLFEFKQQQQESSKIIDNSTFASLISQKYISNEDKLIDIVMAMN